MSTSILSSEEVVALARKVGAPINTGKTACNFAAAIEAAVVAKLAKRAGVMPEQERRFCAEQGLVVANGYTHASFRTYGASLAARVDVLTEALAWREQFEPRAGEDANERFERIAEAFYRETGHLRPGKDCCIESNEVRQEAWDAWMEAGRARIRAALNPTKPAEKEKQS